MERRLLLTPGPLSTSERTRSALTTDHGSRDPRFIALTRELRGRLAALAGGGDLAAVPVQGSGTFAVEAMPGTLVPRTGRVLVLANGAYGERIATICDRIGLPSSTLRWAEDVPVHPVKVASALADDPTLTHVAVVYCETTTGLLNPLADVARVCRDAHRPLLVDAMSAFGALPLDANALGLAAVAASSNKCLEGPPGFGFVIAPRQALADARGRAPSLALDLADQWARFEKDEQWRFTPPTHVVAATVEALRQHEEEGRVEGRGARYRESLRVLVAGLRALGFRTLLPDALQAPIIVTFLAPRDPGYSFEALYDALEARGFVIYPGKLTEAETFRVGCIGQVHPPDLARFVAAMREVLDGLGVGSGAPDPEAGGY